MKKGSYVDGFIITIPAKNAAKYRKMARDGMLVWKKFGALDYKECVADDVLPSPEHQNGSLPFPKLAGAGPKDDVWFSFIVFKNKKHRDEVNKKVMAYFDKKYRDKKMEMPFSMKRFSYGGFKVVVGM